jgi:hypothetical protein
MRSRRGGLPPTHSSYRQLDTIRAQFAVNLRLVHRRLRSARRHRSQRAVRGTRCDAYRVGDKVRLWHEAKRLMRPLDRQVSGVKLRAVSSCHTPRWRRLQKLATARRCSRTGRGTIAKRRSTQKSRVIPQLTRAGGRGYQCSGSPVRCTDRIEQRRESVPFAFKMTVQCAAVDTQIPGHAFCRTQTRRQGHIDAFAGAVPHRGIGAGRHSVKILLNMPRDCRIRGGHADIDVTRQTYDPVALLTKLDARAEKPAMRIRSVGAACVNQSSEAANFGRAVAAGFCG